MKGFCSIALVLIISLKSCECLSYKNFEVNPFEEPQIINAINQVINSAFVNYQPTSNIISFYNSSSEFKIRDIINGVLRRNAIHSNISIRRESLKLLPLTNRKRRCGVFFIDTFEAFSELSTWITGQNFWLDGYFLVVLINGEIKELEEIFKILWERQIINVNIIFEDEKGVLQVKTARVFTKYNCKDTSPVLINKFIDEKFVNDVRKFFPDKTSNMQNCHVRVATENTSMPYVYYETLKNGTRSLTGRDFDFDLLVALSENLNFKINFTFIGAEGYFYSNGSVMGALKQLIDGNADLALADYWIKANRLQLLGASTSYISDQVSFIISPGRELSVFEKTYRPFGTSVWLVIIVGILISLIVIISVKLSSRRVQDFVFGAGVKSPFLNMAIAILGGNQTILPKRNFARYLLAVFLLYSVVMRTAYQGSHYQILKSNKHLEVVQSVDEMMEKDFTFVIFDYMIDLFDVSGRIYQRRQVEPLKDWDDIIQTLQDPSYKGAVLWEEARIDLWNQMNNTPKLLTCKEVYMTIPVVIYTVKDFFLISAINGKIELFRSSGLIDFWHFKRFDKGKLSAAEARHPKPISMNHLSGCFRIHFCALFIGTCAFIFELVSKKVKCCSDVIKRFHRN